MNIRLVLARVIGAVNPIVPSIRHSLREIVIATALAVAAVIVIEACRDTLRYETLQYDLGAVATLEVYETQNKLIRQGTGLFIAPHGKLVTAYHVVKGSANVIAHMHSGGFYPLMRIEVVDYKTDIAILQFDGEPPCVKEFGDSKKLRLGDWIYIIGLEGGVLTGNISTLPTVDDNVAYRLGLASKLWRDFIEFTSPISPKSSGGGLFDMNGELVGITAAPYNVASGSPANKAQKTNIAVPIGFFELVLSRVGQRNDY